MDDEASGSQGGLDPSAAPDGDDVAESRDSAWRDPAGRWLPGRSGNMLGRPAVPQSVRALARQHTVLAVQVLASIAADRGASTGARILAARELLDRGHGRSSPVELPQDLANMSDEDLDLMCDDEDAPPALEHDGD